MLAFTLILFSLSTSCIKAPPDKVNLVESSNMVQVSPNEKVPTDSSAQTSRYLEKEPGPEDIIPIVCEKVENIDFTRKEFPINTALYNTETDLIYKEAFFKAITNKVPIMLDSKEVFFKEIFADTAWEDADFLEVMIKRAGKYHYIDYDGDGLPELTIQVSGTAILKYVPDEDKVYLLEGRDSVTNVLGSGQTYFTNLNELEGAYYEYRSKDEAGNIVHVSFTISWELIGEEWEYHYYVSMDEFQDVEISEAKWYKITKNFFDARDNALPTQSFEEVFGDVL